MIPFKKKTQLEAKFISTANNESISKEKKRKQLELTPYAKKKKKTWIDSISEVKMLARVLVALAASVAAEKVKIGEIQTLAHAVRTKCFDW